MGAALREDDFAQRAAALGERATAAHPTTWRPNDPDKQHPQLLVGELVRVDEGHTSYGPAKIVVLRAPDGVEWGVWLLHAVLKGEFMRLRPRAGELVAIRYLGTVAPRDGRAGYEAYRVVVDRADGAADWDSLEGEPEDSAPPLSQAPAPRCSECGYAEPDHVAGCSADIPF
jgi:hypothetical protein